MSRRYVAVCGPAEAGEREIAWAEEIGRLLAEAGAVLVCGGLGGVMDAAARGCEAAGGISIGLLPAESRAGASSHLSVAVPTGMGEVRNALVVRAADAVIAVSGEFGTLSEIALALKMGRPVVGLHTWSLARETPAVDPLVRAGSPQEAVEKALELAEGALR
ncbi:MAG: TIGR00725 family protein [Actinobacteria bacterium]|nr:TIGR00725 family protein [Actinomycetota bacterium]